MNGLGFSPSTHYAGPIVINYEPSSKFEEGPEISITTENYTLRPTTNEHTVVTFYQDCIFGSSHTMRGTHSRRLDSAEEIKDKVNSFVQRWNLGDFYSSFVVYDKITGYPLAHTVLGHGNAEGESDYSLLIGSEATPKPSIKDEGVPKYTSGLVRTASCDVTGLEPKPFVLSVNKADLAREITYTMFQGWAPWLSEHQKEVMNDVTQTSHPLRSINGTVPRESETFNTLETMLVDNGTNRMDSYSTSAGGTEWTHFFTSVKEMQAMRARIVGDGSSSRLPSLSAPPASNVDATLQAQVESISLNGGTSEGSSTSSDVDMFEMED